MVAHSLKCIFILKCCNFLIPYYTVVENHKKVSFYKIVSGNIFSGKYFIENAKNV